jgi:hypothetical protein
MASFKYLCFTNKPYNIGERKAQIDVTGLSKKEIDQKITEMRPDFHESEFTCTVETCRIKLPTFNRKEVSNG